MIKKPIKVVISAVLIAVVLFMFSGCSKKSDTISIAAKDFTEQYIMGEMLKALVLEHTDLDVDLTSGIAGETSIIMPAMIKGDFQTYSEYDSTAWMTVLKQPKTMDTETMHKELKEIYENDYGITWLGYYGFDNTYSIAVRRETAEEYNLKTYSDLAAISTEIVFGAGYEFFEREDGYQGFQELYGFNFKEIKEMNLSLKYNALLDSQVDAITIYRTDGRMKNDKIVELTDDKDYFPPALCGTVIRLDVLEKYPQLEDVFKMLNNNIDNDEMRAMNAAVDVEGQDPKKVAIEFLQQKGLINNE